MLFKPIGPPTLPSSRSESGVKIACGLHTKWSWRAFTCLISRFYYNFEQPFRPRYTKSDQADIPWPWVAPERMTGRQIWIKKSGGLCKGGTHGLIAFHCTRSTPNWDIIEWFVVDLGTCVWTCGGHSFHQVTVISGSLRIWWARRCSFHTVIFQVTVLLLNYVHCWSLSSTR